MSAPVGSPATRWTFWPLEVALFALALAWACIVVLALVWATGVPYRDLARDNDVTRYAFVVVGTGARYETDLEGAVRIHERWSQYVTGGAEEPPRFDPPLFTDTEYSHMIDVRHVFDLVKLLVPAALVVIIVRLQRARTRGAREMWRLVRDGSLAAAALVLALAIATVLAFDQLFLLFHEIFFSQGNFLFDPATSNLLRVWPEWYWEGMFLRVGLSFLSAAVVLAGIGALRVRAHEIERPRAGLSAQRRD